MRTRLLELQAFGPYKTKQTLDFTTLGDESLFLITGPTGAGKTTIFDAICFSLYGKASGADRDHDTLRSDFSSHETETFVRFTFSVKNETYRVLRKPKQWIPKLRGEGLKEEPATAVLETLIDGTFVVTESKINDVNDKIKAILGLDYDQFLKMIMIPQGEFRRLISENSQEREQILQKLFQTVRYAYLQDYFKEQSKQEEQALKDLNSALDFEWQRIPWDDLDEIEQLTTMDRVQLLEMKLNNTLNLINQNETKQTELKEIIQQKNDNLQRQTQLVEVFNDYETKKRELTVLLEKAPDITEKRQILEAAEKATRLDYYYQDYHNRKKEVEKKVAERDAILEKVGKVTQAYDQQKVHFDALVAKKDAFELIKDDLKEASKQREEWLIYEKKIDEVKAQGNQLRELTEAYEEKQSAVVALTTAIKDKEQTLRERHEVETSYLKAHNELEKQTALLGVVEEALNEERALSELRETYKQQQTKLQSFVAAVSEAKKIESDTEKRWRDGYAYRLSQSLTSGEPCPVCGSPEHPGALHTRVELVSDAVLNMAKTDREQKEQALNDKQAQLAELKLKGTYQREKVDHLLKGVVEDLQSSPTATELLEWIRAHKERLTAIKVNVKHLEQKQRTLQKLAKTLEVESTQQVTLEAELNDMTDAIAKAKEVFHKLETECDLLKQRLPIDKMTYLQFEARFKDKQAKLEMFNREYEKAEQKWHQLQTDKQTLETELKSFTSYLKELREKEAERLQAFEQQLVVSAFKNDAAFLEARQPENVRESLKTHIQTFDEQRQTLAVKIKTLTERINHQPKPDIAPLKAAIAQLDENYNTLIKETTRLEELHTLLLSVQDKVKEQLSEINKATHKFQTVKKLANLSRGDNHLKLSFERFVLSSFLDAILLKANQRLVELTDYRYQLRRSHEIAKRGAQSGLDLEVIDHHTSKVRSVKTLSGGEGFKASLSLALGMADVVQAYSGGIQLDTLFIDEGFGTLDDISLEQAINTLKGLSQKNRILGIISHVPQLKEEIYAKLEITTSPSGSDAAFTF
ncbi:nuclease SbcCD subunit C [Halolactibacillus alkaliphilus]|uniref:Nuclease SbcCD subunit C n=1 Tax=Halolactibacillus alkaliphilus TaxID=442899 RepID=A0A511X132_9BACI|nr:SbcC/MukB-like Walker B domain-containing protein [Halolactibacillus alkaliphilus]GEN56649.1 nuclease SbcCD subunit C [Halolactibacillus alkaliphilus]GGN70304.1 nuclease SbcCD subunit C [Halolactibacillus alkaliphilus]SFO77194.1 exonuclease SbcC [Halolactibacillus alkaliphilus]